jgi:glyceraldehyde-3-phosphate dehydrogenase/erythrose-4-phosphate dehydrogenase
MKIRVGIVGFGFMGQMHALVYKALPNVEIVGIADDHTGVESVIVQLGIKAVLRPSLTSLLEAVELDVIDILASERSRVKHWDFGRKIQVTKNSLPCAWMSESRTTNQQIFWLFARFESQD